MVTPRARPLEAAPQHARLETLASALAQARRELLAAEEALQRSESALAAIADGIVITDLFGRITSLNPVACHLSGWLHSEALGRPLSDVVRIIDTRGDMVDLLGEGFRNGNDEIGSLVRRDGHVILVDGAVAQIHDQRRNQVGNIVTFRNVTAATRMARELSYHANHDALTGLLNRRVMEARLERALASADELDCRHALLYFDLDHFKAINDNAGHVAGDELLRQLALLLHRQLRQHDTLARMGGDEFAVLLENCSGTHASAVAEKIRSTVEGFAFTWEGRVHRTGASVGQVEFTGRGLVARDVVEAADRMCYAAKAAGRGRVAACNVQGIDPGRRERASAGSRKPEAEPRA